MNRANTQQFTAFKFGFSCAYRQSFMDGFVLQKHWPRAVVLGLGLALFSDAVFSQTTPAYRLHVSNQQAKAMNLESAIPGAVEYVPSHLFPAEVELPLNQLRQVSSPIEGKVVKLNKIYGNLTAGEVLAEIEAPELLMKQQDYLSVLAELKIAKNALARARKLNKTGVSSTKKLQLAQLEVNKLDLNLSQIKQQLSLLGMSDEALKRLNKTKQLQPPMLQIKSPMDGYIVKLQASLGQRINKNQALFSIAKNNAKMIVAHVPLSRIKDVSIGQAVEIQGMEIAAKVTHIEPMVDPMTQASNVYIGLNQSAPLMRIGQLLNIRFLSTTPSPSFKVSSQAMSQCLGATDNPKTQVSEAQSCLFVKQGNYVQPYPIKVWNVTDGQLYFSWQDSQILEKEQTNKTRFPIYTRGSISLKAAWQQGMEYQEQSQTTIEPQAQQQAAPLKQQQQISIKAAYFPLMAQH